MIIRRLALDDRKDVYRLHLSVFAQEERETVACLARDLLSDVSAQPLQAFGAFVGDRLVGSVIFTGVRIQDAEPVKAAILAPLAVATDQQRHGIGSTLVRHGLAELKRCGVGLVLVYGDPKYYSRFGFAPGHRVSAPFPLQHPTGWLACELVEGLFRSTMGVAICAASLSRPEYW
jgi:predicted N-acetyltransferase YhbS